MRQMLIWIVVYLIVGCTSSNHHQKPFLLEGAWILRQKCYPAGENETFTDHKGTILRLYDSDSVMYQCWLTKTETGLVVKPLTMTDVTLIDKGGSEYLYLESDNPRPLTVNGDSSIVIQQDGVLYTWYSAQDIADEWGNEVMNITAENMEKNKFGESQSYVLSAKERQQENVIHGFIFVTLIVITLMLLIARIAIDNRKAKRRLQLQLQQIQEVQQERPLSVKQAIESVEKDYFASDEYTALQRHITSGQRLKSDDWQNIEHQIKKVYPGFSSQLRGLYTMSELEHQVCLLTKLRIAPSDMATVLARDASTISTVRSRLYKKVFGQKGGAKEWDEFILSIGV